MHKKYISFAGLCLGFFITMMDITTIPFTYTTLMSKFNITPIEVAWVNNIYLITYAAFLLLGGRLGDFLNRKNVVLVAYLALATGAAISGSAQTFLEILIGRAIMGIGASFLTPQSMAYISILFPKGGRGTALGIWGAVAGVATATGPVITQIFLISASWRWVMWINIPIAAICLLLAALNLPKIPGRGINFLDTTICFLFGMCIAAVTLGIQFLSAADRMIGVGITLFLIGAMGISILLRNEIVDNHPYILSSELWRDRIYLKICFISGLLGFSLSSFYLPLAFLLDIRMNFSPLAICTFMIAISLSHSLVGIFSGRMSDRTNPEIIVKYGLFIFALANILIGFIGLLITKTVFFFISMCIAMLVAGSGTGLAFAPLANLALSRAQPNTVGVAAAFFNCMRQLSSALGGVVIASVFDYAVRLQLNSSTLVSTANLRESLYVTAIAAFVCFFVIALSLVLATRFCRNRQDESAEVCYATEN